MNNLERAQRDWETPPDELEAEVCDTCGHEMEVCTEGYGKRVNNYLTCNNPWCPDKLNPTTKYNGAFVIDVAKKVVELEQELIEEEANNNKLLKEVDILRALVREMNHSKSTEILRDTQYAIKRMEDAIEYAYLDCGMNGEGRRTIWLEWAECKKIMEQL